MKELVIIGAGGFGRNVFWQCFADIDHERVWSIKGFLDDRPNVLDGFKVPRPILGSPFEYKIQPDEIWLCALGSPEMRRKYSAPIAAQGANFISVYPDVGYPPSVRSGRGIIFEPKVQLGSDSVIGSFVVMCSLAVIGHDVHIGDFTQVSSMVFVGGGARIGSDVQLHPHACVLPGVSVGNRAIVGAGSVVIHDVPPDCTVFGNPAKVIHVR